MSFGPELVARLGLDATAFQRGLSQATSTAGTFGEQLDKKFSTKTAFKSLVAGIGISVETIAETIAEAWVGGTRRGLEEAADAYDREAQLIEKNIFDRLPDEAARRASIQKQIEKQAEIIMEPRRGTTTPETTSYYMSNIPVKTGGEKIYTETEEAYNKRVRDARQRIQELQSTQIQNQNKDKQESISLDKQLAAAEDARLMRELSSEQKVAHLAFKKLIAEKDVERAEDGSVEQKKAKIELERVTIQLLEAQKSLEEESLRLARDKQQEQEKYERKAERILELGKQQAEAEERLDEAKKDLATTQADRFGVSIADAAAGKGVSQTSKARARQIASLEDRARRVFQSGSTDMRDAKGNRISAADYAQQLQNRADALRKNSGFLTSQERDPLQAQTKAVMESEKHLKKISAALDEEVSKPVK